MANEFIARNGIIANADSRISGTLNVSGDINMGGVKIATESYVTTALANLIDTAPSTLDTLNELAAALGDDPNFATTVTNSIATKLPLAGGTMTGNINWTSTDLGLVWTMNTDGAYIKFFNTGDGDTNSRLEYATSDNGNEYHRFMVSGIERMAITESGISATGYNKSNWDTAYSWGNNYISDVRVEGTSLVFTGQGSAYNESVDLSALPFQAQGSYLTAESDTLDSVTGRGASTTNSITVGSTTINPGYLTLSGASSSVNPELSMTDDSGFDVAGFKMRYGNPDGWTYYDSYWASGGGHRFRTSVASSTIEALTIKHDGNVGIGTTSPSEKLSVAGTIQSIGGTNNGKYVNVYVNDNWAYYTTNAAATYMNAELRVDTGLIGSYDEALQLRTAGTTRIYVDTSGNVGIGTEPNQGVRLQVSGVVDVWNSLNTLLRLNHDGTRGIIESYTGGGYSNTAINPYGGNVGIGTTSPGSKLVSEISAPGYSIVGQHSSGGQVGFYNSTADNGVGTVNNYPLNLFTNNSAPQVTLTTGGNVGIGTTSPNGTGWDESSTVLHIYKNATNGGLLKLESSNTSAILNAGDNQLAIFTTTEDPIRLGTNGSERMRITSDGNVGIGTTSPNSLLHVYNNADVWHARIGGASGELRIGGQTNSGAVIQAYTPGGSVRDLYLQRDGGNVGIGTSSPAEKLHIYNGGILIEDGYALRSGSSYGAALIGRAVGASSAISIGSGQAGDYLKFLAGGSESMRITSDGNVGINTTIPSSKLHVKGSTSGADVFAVDGVNGRLFTVTDDLSDSLFSVNTIAGLPVIEAFADNTVTLGAYNQYDLHITGSKVGIGTSTPAGKTQIVGPTLGTTSETTYPLWLSDTGDTTKALILGYDLANDAGVIQAVDRAVAWKNVLISPTGGNVGVGTTSPTLGLHVGNGKGFIVGESGASGSMYVSPQDENTINGSYGIASDTADIWLNYRGYQDGFSYFRDTRIGNGKGTAVVMVDGSSGNVGIGTTSPDNPLEVVGADSGIKISSSAANRPQLRLECGTTENLILSTNTDYGAIGDSSDLNRVVLKSGNVGIGTASPLYKLDVAGAIRLTGSLTFDDTTSNLIQHRAGNDVNTLVTVGHGGFDHNGYLRISGANVATQAWVTSQGYTTTTYVDEQIAAIVDSAPDALNTLKELSNALGDDQNFATNVTNSIAAKVSKSGDTMTGDLTLNYGYPRINFYDSNHDSDYSLINNDGGFSLYDITNNVHRWWVTSDGNVGIGTTSPGNRRLVVSQPTNDEWIAGFVNTGASPYGVYIDTGANPSTTYSFATYTNEGTGFFIRNNGLVGIGTNSPSYNLDVTGTVNSGAYRLSGGFTMSNMGGYAELNNWVHLPGYHGLYSGINGAHIYPNNGSYGSWRIQGSRNNYRGLEFGSGVNGDVSLMIHENSNITGFHNNSYGWQFRWENGTLYCDKNSYGGGTSAVVLDSSNYTSYAATSAQGSNADTAHGWGNHANYGYWNTDLTEPKDVQSTTVRFVGDVEVQGTFTESSSIRFKENIQPLEPTLSKVEQLNPVTYNKIGVEEQEIGLIAEEVAELFPEVVTYNEEGQPSGIQYQRLSVILLKAVQELTDRVNKLENK